MVRKRLGLRVSGAAVSTAGFWATTLFHLFQGLSDYTYLALAMAVASIVTWRNIMFLLVGLLIIRFTIVPIW